MSDSESESDIIPEGMEKCQITGMLISNSDIVELHGYRVGAEGKLELLRRLRAGMAMPGEMETSSIGARFVAMLVDSFFLGFVAVVGGLIIGVGVFSAELMSPGGDTDETMLRMFKLQGAATLAFYAISLSYFAIFHGMKGQTPGKMAAKIIVVDYDGAPISKKVAWLRAIFYQGPYMLSPIALLVLWDVESLSMASAALSVLAGLYGLADLVLALADRAEQKSLHDRLASTRVVVKS